MFAGYQPQVPCIRRADRTMTYGLMKNTKFLVFHYIFIRVTSMNCWSSADENDTKYVIQTMLTITDGMIYTFCKLASHPVALNNSRNNVVLRLIFAKEISDIHWYHFREDATKSKKPENFSSTWLILRAGAIASGSRSPAARCPVSLTLDSVSSWSDSPVKSSQALIDSVP